MNGTGWNLLWEHGEAGAGPEPSEEREPMPPPPAAREARRATAAGRGELAAAWAGRASDLQARLGNHAVQRLLEPSAAREMDDGRHAAVATQEATRSDPAATPPERRATPMHDADKPVSLRPLESGQRPAPPAKPVSPVAEPELEAVPAEPTPTPREPAVAPEPLPQAAQRALARDTAAHRAAALAQLLFTLPAGVSTADWVALAASHDEASDTDVDAAVRAIVERVLGLPAAQRRRVDRQLALLAALPVVADLARRVTARLAVMSTPAPEPAPPPADD